MIIGTIHKDEAIAYDSHEGYHQFHMEVDEGEKQETYGSFLVFWWKGGHMYDNPEGEDLDEWRDSEPSGWYWHACFTGCLPDADSAGPFGASIAAHADADVWAPEHIEE